MKTLDWVPMSCVSVSFLSDLHLASLCSVWEVVSAPKSQYNISCSENPQNIGLSSYYSVLSNHISKRIHISLLLSKLLILDSSFLPGTAFIVFFWLRRGNKTSDHRGHPVITWMSPSALLRIVKTPSLLKRSSFQFLDRFCLFWCCGISL